jgi:hypothetical protein
MEAVSTSTESHNGDDATQLGSNHVTRGMRIKSYTAMFKLEVVDFATMSLHTMNDILCFTFYSCICDKIPVKAELQKIK